MFECSSNEQQRELGNSAERHGINTEQPRSFHPKWTKWIEEASETSTSDSEHETIKEGTVMGITNENKVIRHSPVHSETSETRSIQRRRTSDWFDGISGRHFEDTPRRQRSPSRYDSTIDWDILSESSRHSIASEKVATSSYTEYLEKSYNTDSGGSDSDVDTFEEEFEDIIHRYARAISSKSVSGLHRYISSIIVPNGHDGIDRCIQELESLIERYSPVHWYIISSHGDHIVIIICFNLIIKDRIKEVAIPNPFNYYSF